MCYPVPPIRCRIELRPAIPMRRTLKAALALTLLCAPLLSAPAPRQEVHAGAAVPIVVELFTSEGCSDCPRADALLAQLDRLQPVAGALIIPLEEHVDYWDQQGWRDPFSSYEFTARQVTYAGKLHVASPYTPQMVVAGTSEFVGSAGSKALAAISAAEQLPRAELSLMLEPAAPPSSAVRATIAVPALPAAITEAAEVWVAFTEDGLASKVSAGENNGRNLEHRAVVRKLSRAGKIKSGQAFSETVETKLGSSWKRENLRVVAFLSGTSTGHIYGAATARLSP